MELELMYIAFFVNYIHKNSGIPKDEIYRLISYLEIEIEWLGRGRHLVRRGMQNDCFYFVCSGILLTYQELACKRLTLSFGFKDYFVFCPDSLFDDVETAYDIVALQKSVVIRINHLKFNEVCTVNPQLVHLKNRLVQNYTNALSRHRQILLKNNAATSYKEMISSEGSLAEIPIKYLSSYLGIHPNSLSRIRAEIFRKQD